MKNIAGSAINVGNIAVEQGEKTKIAEAAYGVLMEMLSGIYADAAAAVLREYSVNGWDEHRRFGSHNDRPVEVTLPTVLQPVLIIRDYGNRGLAANHVMKVFGEYGESDKRQDDDSAGGFGIGSKAAFALGQQFMVTGFQGGQQFTALFTLNEDGTGTKTVMDEGATEEPNGVQVSLAVEDVEGMRESAKRFFSFWNRGEVVVDWGDGFEEPTPIFETLQKVNDEIHIDPHGRGEAFAVMGPVAYPIDRPLLRKVSAFLKQQGMDEVADLPIRLVDSNTDLYISVPIGGVRPAPSREALRDKDITVRTIGSVFLGLHQDSVVKIQNDVTMAPSFYAAAKAFHDSNENLGVFSVSRKAITWQGQRITEKAPVDLVNFSLHVKSWRSDTKIVGVEPKAVLKIEDAEKSLVVVGVAPEQVGSVRRFAKRYLENNQDGVERVFVSEATAASFRWFQYGVPQGVRTLDLDGWRAVLRTMRSSVPRDVNEPSYTTGFQSASRDLEDRDLLSEIIEEGLDIVIFHDSARNLSRFEREVLADYTVVVLLGTQSEDMLRKRIERSGAVKVVEWSDLHPKAVAAAQAVVDSFTDEEKEALGAREWLSSWNGTRSEVQHLMKHLSRVGKVTNKTLLSIEDSFALAEFYAAPVTETRLKEIREARQALGLNIYNLDDITTPYQDDVVAYNAALPLLSIASVRQAGRRITKHVRPLPDFTFEYATSRWESYDADSHQNDLTLLQHSLEYVNSH